MAGRQSVSKLVFNKARRLLTNPMFHLLTILGNLVIFSSATALFFLEHELNPNMKEPLDAIWWAMSTVSTVGYGDVHPVTRGGKFVGIALMVVGSALFWSYTALFADALLSAEMSDLEIELKALEAKLEKARAESQPSERILKTLRNIEGHLAELKERRRS